MNGPCFIRYPVVTPGQYIGDSFDDYNEALTNMLSEMERIGSAGMDVLLFIRNGDDEVLLTRKQIISMSFGGNYSGGYGTWESQSAAS